MMKHLMIGAACLLGASLNAETIGDVEFQFPPSNYEWKLFADNSTQFFDVEEEYDDDETEFKFFTHREGEALELFLVFQAPSDEEDEEEINTLATVQSNMDEMLNQFLPNHRLNVINYTESDGEGFFEWELHDGSLDLLHGYTRGFEKDGITVVLSYFTTAPRTEINRAVWTNVLTQAK